MNNETFQQARMAYEAKDYETALAAYTDCLQDYRSPLAPGEMGLLYHQIGNCLVKLNDYGEAIHAYSQATADSTYDGMGTVNYNLGMAYAVLKDYENAVKHFEIAVSDAKYDTPYKAYTSMGNALLKLGKSAEAGMAFRQAALDDKNPDPTKALLNLGICFMALDRPQDAVTSYESALPFDMSQETRNKLFASLGQAYVATGQMQNAVTAFETALADKTYFLNDSASVDYQRAIAAVSTGALDVTAALSPIDADTSGLDVAADGTPMYGDDGPYGNGVDLYAPADQGFQDGYASDDDRFFNASDEELEMWSKGLAKQSRKRRNVGLKIAVVIIALIVVLMGGAVFAYIQGYGYPTQETVVKELFANPENAQSTVFSKDLDAATVKKLTSLIEADGDVAINGVNRSMSESTVYVTSQTSSGGDVQYRITLTRDVIGWKVSGVELYFASQNQ